MSRFCQSEHTPPQIKISTVVDRYSIATACNGVKSGCGAVTHREGPVAPNGRIMSTGVITINKPYPINAPINCAIKYTMAI